MQGTKSLLAHLDRIQNAVKKGVPDKVSEVVEKRKNGAQQGYASAQYVGINDVIVDSVRVGNEWQIIASGSTLLFIEFGTGIIYPHTNHIDHPYNFAGSWSVEHSQYLTDSEKLAKYKGQWPDPYSKKLVDGNPSANVMYQTGKTIVSTLPIDLIDVLNEAIKS